MKGERTRRTEHNHYNYLTAMGSLPRRRKRQRGGRRRRRSRRSRGRWQKWFGGRPNEGEASGTEGGKPRCTHRGHLVLYLWLSAMISSLLFRRLRKFYALRTILTAPRQRERNGARRRWQPETTLALFVPPPESASSLSTAFSSSCTTSSSSPSYFCSSGPTIRQIARNNGTPPGNPFRMLHALTLAALLAPRITGNPLASRGFFRRRTFVKTYLGHL